jgi:hypothetical protein
MVSTMPAAPIGYYSAPGRGVIGTSIDEGRCVGVTVAPALLAVLNVVPGGADFLSAGHLKDAANTAIDTTATMSAMIAGCFSESPIRDNAGAVGRFQDRMTRLSA